MCSIHDRFLDLKMDKFDELSNSELREQLKAHNLGNFPVTDTTRNALIKKLRNAVNGPAKPVKVRRETLGVVKHSAAEESESETKIGSNVENRRKTLQVGPSVSTNSTSIKTTGKPIEDTSSAYKRRYTSYMSTVQNTHAADSSDDILNKVETPFLSDFTRRLAQLKAEKLPGTETSIDYKSPKSTTSAYLSEYHSAPYGTSRSNDRYRDKQTSSLKHQNPSVWLAFEKKLRWPILIILSVFIAVSAYVFLSSNY